MSQPAPSRPHSSRPEFFDYYAEKSLHPESVKNFRTIQNKIQQILERSHGAGCKFDALDVGCNAGTQCIVWAELGHQVHGLDINEPLLELAQKRASAKGYKIDFRIGTATNLPWPDESMDACIALELLEHVSAWQTCLEELHRVLRPGGVMFVTTTNALCPLQNEFNLPGYSWYPGPLKRYIEHLAFTTRPGLANYAKFPAVHWFTPYGLKARLSQRGYSCFDRFDLVDTSDKGVLATQLIHSVRAIPLLRWLGFLCTPGTMVLAVKSIKS